MHDYGQGYAVVVVERYFPPVAVAKVLKDDFLGVERFAVVAAFLGAAALSAPAKTIVSIVSIFVSSFMCVLGVGYIVEIVICYVPGVSKCRR